MKPTPKSSNYFNIYKTWLLIDVPNRALTRLKFPVFSKPVFQTTATLSRHLWLKSSSDLHPPSRIFKGKIYHKGFFIKQYCDQAID